MSSFAIHRPEDIFSARHVPSWLMLAFASGCTNSTAFVACERLVTHVTGSVTQAGIQIARVEVVLDFLLLLGCFIGGAMVATYMINVRARRRLPPWYTLPLLVVVSLTIAVALAGSAGLFGPFGGSVDGLADLVMLSTLAFASGLQNASVGTSTGLLVRTTHLTGPATDLGMHLMEMICCKGEEQANARRHAFLRAGKIASFACGAAVGVLVAPSWGYLTFLLPAAIILVATIMSFEPARAREFHRARRFRELWRGRDELRGH